MLLQFSGIDRKSAVREDSLDRMILVGGTAVEEEKTTSLFYSLAISVITYQPGE
jgi:hypothetical protein